MRVIALILSLLPMLFATGCGQEEGEGDGAVSGLFRSDGIWTGNLTREGNVIGTSATAVVWQGEIFVFAPQADVAFAGRLNRENISLADASPERELSPESGTTGPTSDLSRPTSDLVPDRPPVFTDDSAISPTFAPAPPNIPRDQARASGRTIEASGEIRAFSQQGAPVGAGRITATIVPESSLTGTIAGTREDNRLNLGFSDLFPQEVLLSDLVGSWSTTRGDRTLTFTVRNTGTLTGDRTDGCVFSGGMELLRRGDNLFRATFSIENCGGENGRFSGFAFLDFEALGPAADVEQLWVLAENELQDRFFSAILDRQ